MNDEKNDEILRELRQINKLLALIATRDQSQREQIETLTNIGLKPKGIAELLGTTSNTVNVALYGIRKKRKTPRGKPRKSSK